MKEKIGKFKYASSSDCILRDNKKFMYALEHSLMFYKRNLLYTFIPKNACSSLRVTLACENGCIKLDGNYSWIHDNNSTFRASLKDAICASASFVVLREPKSRLVSCFFDKLVGFGVEGAQYWANRGRDFSYSNLTFRDFLMSLKKDWLLNSDPHWRPQKDFLLYENYSHYFRVEKLQELEHYLFSEHDIELIDSRSFFRHDSNSLTESEAFHPDMRLIDAAQLKAEGFKPVVSKMYDSQMNETFDEIFKRDIILYQSVFGI